MTIDERACNAAKCICDALKQGKPSDGIPRTDEQAWDLLRNHVVAAVKSHLEDAYAAGKRDGMAVTKPNR